MSDMEKGEACNHSVSIILSQLVFHREDLEMHVLSKWLIRCEVYLYNV